MSGGDVVVVQYQLPSVFGTETPLSLNMSSKLVPEDTFHDPMSWLNADASLNISSKIVPDDTFQEPMS